MIWSFLFAHVLVDFLFQTNETAKNKLDIKKTTKHSIWVFVITLIVAILAGLGSWYILLPIFVISVMHGLIDYFKAKLENKLDCNWKWLLFVGDQILHVIVIFLCINIFYSDISSGYLEQISHIFLKIDILKILSFLVLITFGGSYFTGSVCKAFEPNGKNTDDSLEKAGRYIGILERVIICASILIGRYEIIGFLIAAKSIIRHPDKDKKAFSEYFLIGTFTSFIWAAFFTFLYLKM